MVTHDGCGDGHSGRRLRFDLSTGVETPETVSPAQCRTFVGGGLEATRQLLAETEPGYDALSPEAPLHLATGAVTGLPHVGLARVVVAAKSPLTGGIGESRVEGPFGQALKRTGWDSILLLGRSETPVYLFLTPDGATAHDATHLVGLDTGATTDALEEAHGPDVHVACVGPAGEAGIRFAGIVTDRTFPAARMGLGAVMGSKNLKAVVVAGGSTPTVHDPAGLTRLTAEYADRIPRNDLTRSQAEVPGFGAWPTDGDALEGYGQGLNYASSRIVALGPLTAQSLVERVVVASGTCPGCPGDCIKTFQNRADVRAGGLHQEAVAAFALNLGLTDPDLVLELNARCHLWGVDPVSLSFTLSLLCEAAEHGLLGGVDLGGHEPRFGDAARLVPLIADVATGAEAVRWVGEGARRVADRLPPEASRFALHVKGLEMVSFEPRASAGQALSYAVSPIGPRYEIVEHDKDFDPVGGWSHGRDLMRTHGLVDWEPMEVLDDRRVGRTAALLDLWSGMDALGISLFAGPPVRELDLPRMAELVEGVTGWRTSDHELMTWGRRRWHLMRWFNLREGLTIDDDVLPDRLLEDPIDAGRHAGVRLGRDRFLAARDLYYEIVGWGDDGRPTRAALVAVGLDPSDPWKVPT